MPVEVILPVLGETMDEGTIVKWFVKVGDSVHKGEPLYQVETDKAALDVESPASGTLRRIICDQGQKVKVLSVVGLIGASDEDVSSWDACSSQAGARPAPSTPVSAKELAIETAKEERVVASPRARKLASERGVNVSHVTGTGPGGRVTEKDVLGHLEKPSMTPVARKMAADAGLDASQLAGAVERRRITKADVEVSLTQVSAPVPDQGAVIPAMEKEIRPLTGLRSIIAERMSASAHTTARVTLTTEVDAVELTRLRTLLRDSLESTLGFAVSYSDILVAVVSRALREYPYMNARLTEGGIRTLSQINVGVAVDTERGLLVPVIRDAERKGIAEIAQVFRELTGRAHVGKSTPDDLTGGTFTITNLGMFDIDAFTPIINLPECAILGAGRIQERAVVRAGQICVRQVMVLSLTFDHRVVDGAPAARFLQRIKQFIETPALLLV